jgi:hypothetical protein
MIRFLLNLLTGKRHQHAFDLSDPSSTNGRRTTRAKNNSTEQEFHDAGAAERGRSADIARSRFL